MFYFGIMKQIPSVAESMKKNLDLGGGRGEDEKPLEKNVTTKMAKMGELTGNRLW